MTTEFLEGLETLTRQIAEDAADAAINRIVKELHEMKPKLAELRTVSQIAAECPAWTQQRLYKTISEYNDEFVRRGIVVRDSGRVLMDVSLFYEWLRGCSSATSSRPLPSGAAQSNARSA